MIGDIQIKLNKIHKIFLKFRVCSVMTSIIALTMCIGCSATSGRTLQMVYPSQVSAADMWPDKSLEKRFSKYWVNRFSGRVEENYAVEYPYFQERIPLPKYKSYAQHAAKNGLLKMEIQKIQHVSDYLVAIDCLATIQVGGEAMDVSLVDRWVMVDGTWYHIIKDPLFQI
jgi:hypothetical protein